MKAPKIGPRDRAKAIRILDIAAMTPDDSSDGVAPVHDYITVAGWLGWDARRADGRMVPLVDLAYAAMEAVLPYYNAHADARADAAAAGLLRDGWSPGEPVERWSSLADHVTITVTSEASAPRAGFGVGTLIADETDTVAETSDPPSPVGDVPLDFSYPGEYDAPNPADLAPDPERLPALTMAEAMEYDAPGPGPTT